MKETDVFVRSSFVRTVPAGEGVSIKEDSALKGNCG